MKRRFYSLLLVLSLLACVCAQAEEQVAMRIVACPEQGFATLCKPEYDYYFTDDGGIMIELGAKDDDPWVSIFKTDAPGADFDAEYYLTNVYRQQVSSAADAVVNEGEYTVITLGQKELPAIMMMYVKEGESRYRLCAYDLQADYFVRYEVGCAAMDIPIEDALKALAVAVGNFQPDADYYAK